jgi:hypothetical protein
VTTHFRKISARGVPFDAGTDEDDQVYSANYDTIVHGDSEGCLQDIAQRLHDESIAVLDDTLFYGSITDRPRGGYDSFSVHVISRSSAPSRIERVDGSLTSRPSIQILVYGQNPSIVRSKAFQVYRALENTSNQIW